VAPVRRRRARRRRRAPAVRADRRAGLPSRARSRGDCSGRPAISPRPAGREQPPASPPKARKNRSCRRPVSTRESGRARDHYRLVPPLHCAPGASRAVRP
jgi:hypothetical protein